MKAKNKNIKNIQKPSEKMSESKSRRYARALEKQKSEAISKKWFIPLVIVIAVIPLISIIHPFSTEHLAEYPWFSTENERYDTFLYYKSFFLRLAGIAMLVVMGCFAVRKDGLFKPKKRDIAPIVAIGVFAVFSLASAILSAHREDALWGGYEQFEGAFVLVSYTVCFYFAFGYVRTKDLMRFFLDVILVGTAIMGVLGVFQAFGLDWAKSDWGKFLMSLELMVTGKSAAGVDISTWQGTSYITLYNPNYVGSYIPLVLPYLAYILYRGDKRRRIISGVVIITHLIILNNVRSESGMVGMVAGAVVFVLLILPYLKKKFRIVICGVGAVCIVAAVVFVVSRGYVSVFFSEHTPINTIDSIENDDNILTIYTNQEHDIRLTFDKTKYSGFDLWSDIDSVDGMITVTDASSDEKLNLTYEDNLHATISEEGYPALEFSFENWSISAERSADGLEHEFPVFHIRDGSYDWTMLNAGDDGELKYYNTAYGKIDDFHDTQVGGFVGMESFASGRGYIWGRTIPFLGKCTVVGYGADNFIYEFPQDDYVGKMYFGYNNLITSRPHNTYLQIWMQDGLIALIAFLFLYILYMVRVIILCFSRKYRADKPDEGVSYREIAIVTAVAATAYTVTGVGNDSLVAIAPVFWSLLGIGYAAEGEERAC